MVRQIIVKNKHDASRTLVYKIDKKLSGKDCQKIGRMLVNPVTQEFEVDKFTGSKKSKWFAEIGFLPGVTDNAATTAQELHAIRHDLRGIAVLALFVLPLAGTDSSLDINRRAFLEVFAGNFRELAEKSDPVPLGMLLLLAALVLPDLSGCNTDVGHGVATRQVARFRIRAQVADQDYFVY